MRWDPGSRRLFLQGLGGFALALPFLPSLAPRALGATVPSRRFIGVGTSWGVYPEWWPGVKAEQSLAPGVFSADLTSVSGDLSRIFTNQHFSDLKTKVLFLRGLDTCYTTNHNGHNVFAAASAGGSINRPGTGKQNVSVDWLLGESPVTYPSPPKVRNLVLCPDPLGRRDHGSYTYARSSNGYAAVASIGGAQTAFDVAFKGELATSDAPSAPRPDDLKTVVDKVFADYKRLRGSSQMSAADRLRLDDHLTHLSEIQRQLLAPSASPAGAATCNKPAASPTLASATEADWEQTTRNHLDIVVAALACGTTKVASISFRNAWVAAYYGSRGYHEEVSHSTTNSDGHAKVQGAMARHVAYLIRKLDSIMESDGRSLLYHSIVMWNNSLGRGSTHASYELPVFMAGNGGGNITPGRLLDYRYRPFTKSSVTKNQNIGRPYNQLLVSILQAMGLEPKDYEQDGNPGFGVYDDPEFVSPGLEPYHGPYKTLQVKRAFLPGLRV